MQAAASGDTQTLSQILAIGFKHTNYQGVLTDRQQDLRKRRTSPPYSEHTSQQEVDVVGNVAIVHGMNTITEHGKVVLHLRYTDVYVLRNCSWQALSAQETPILSSP